MGVFMAALCLSVPAQAQPQAQASLIDETRLAARELLDMTAEMYVTHDTLDDLRGLRAFHQTPPGRRMVALTPNAGLQTFAAGRMWGERVGGDAIRKNAEELRRRGITL